MFFSSFYFLCLLLLFNAKKWGKSTFRAAKLHKSFELRKFNEKFFTFHFPLFTFFRTFAPETRQYKVKNQQRNQFMINSQDIKKGTAIRMDGGIWVCIDFQHRKPGKGNTIMIIKLKNVSDGRVLERRFNIGEKLEDVIIERRPYQYLYEDNSGRIFMNQETFEQIPIDNELVIGHEYMKESDIVEVVSDTTDGTILYAEMPVKTILRVTHSEPGIKGDTATNTLKPATLETGVEVRVPLFINEGDLIQVDTRDGSYLARAKE
jgi:elongation factor P